MRTIKQTETYKAISRHVIQPLRLESEYGRAKLRAAVGAEFVPAFWFMHANWGDALNPFLIGAITDKPVYYTRHPRLLKYIVIGSIINAVDRNTIVWGAGAVSSQTELKSRPKRVCAVRGPLTRDLMMKQGCQVPEIYGDPALLMPRFYNPEVSVQYEVGIVPHYVDKEHPWLDQFRDSEHACVIDVEDDTLGFVRQVKRCRQIISSSLHGIICADAYGIPATWVEFSDRVFGDGFKFRDYFASIGRTEYRRERVTEDTTLRSVIDAHVPYKVETDLEALLDACPFR